jgi:hypothetical protein
MSFGSGSVNYLVNSPQAVGQLAVSRLQLFEGEWFLDLTAGLALSQVLGVNSLATVNLAYQDVLSGTQGFADYASFSSNINTSTRSYTANTTLDTIYSTSIGAPGLAPNQVAITRTVTI